MTDDDKTPRISNDPIDLDFIVEGTKSIEIPEKIESEFCPHIIYCPHKDIDDNCFYNKFLHCDEARILEKDHPLSKRDAHFLKYRDVGIG